MSRAIDMASDREMVERDLALANIRASAKRITPLPTGLCPWCSDPTAAPDDVFCCTECAKDWQEHNERKQTAARINGMLRQ
ncbi:hypothetical protein [Silvimonas sp.]|uniref:hypothetical protein n=1 Tax=Silvimonas sp. TaxID=2650811 RepID=UPI00284675F4|nr:hypothetical protein [Silvimonas sp.]MDR3429708.1 hypothetical protein [Silvimonas sp.]